MSYQVLARKWRPQRFDEVVGQQAITRTLRNAIAGGRVAQAFVFAGARGCGKTTTARILARALNCVSGPTPDPCGECDACLEIAQGRDIDVLEIDAASHTGIDNIREVVIAGLAIAPARDRFKVFIIDEVHQLSTSSFNALLKSIEEPPAHVVFVMATTELHKIPDTILSRTQLFEFRTIPTGMIGAQLRTIATAEGIEVSDAALALLARSAEGSMRDAQSAFDQVISFAGTTMTVDDVSTVLGLVGRDLLFDVVESVLDEDAPGAFALVDRAMESGHELRLVVRELARLVRDIMVVSVDPKRAADPEIGEGDASRLTALAPRFSREDLMRAFDVLAKAEQDIRMAAQPRYHVEMALLRWMHLRKLVPLEELLTGAGTARVPPALAATRASAVPQRQVAVPAFPPAEPRAASGARPASEARVTSRGKPAAARRPPAAAAGTASAVARPTEALGSLKDALLSEIRGAKGFFYNTIVAQAQKIEVTAERVTFTFLPAHGALREQFDQSREWLETIAERLPGGRLAVVSAAAEGADAATPEAGAEPPTPAPVSPVAVRDLKEEALASTAVQAVLDVFPSEIRDVEEM